VDLRVEYVEQRAGDQRRQDRRTQQERRAAPREQDAQLGDDPDQHEPRDGHARHAREREPLGRRTGPRGACAHDHDDVEPVAGEVPERLAREP
jgi:hypothetical protein